MWQKLHPQVSIQTQGLVFHAVLLACVRGQSTPAAWCVEKHELRDIVPGRSWGSALPIEQRQWELLFCNKILCSNARRNASFDCDNITSVTSPEVPVGERRGPLGVIHPAFQCPKMDKVATCTVWYPDLFIYNRSCPLFLGVPQHSAGLGHSFHDFIQTLGLAARNRLTLHAVFGNSTTHHSNNMIATVGYFFGDLFSAQLPESNSCTEVKASTILELDSAILMARSTCHTALSLGIEAPCTYFEVPWTVGNEPAGTRRFGGGLNLAMIRRIFEANTPRRVSVLDSLGDSRGAHLAKLRGSSAFLSDPKQLRVSVHIRRGDLNYYYRDVHSAHDVEQNQLRLMPNKVIISVLERIFDMLLGPDRLESGRARFQLDVVLHCEGMRDVSAVPNLNGTSTNFARALSKYSDSMTLRAGPTDAITAFNEMCFSDIVIGGLSAFSGMAAILCRAPILFEAPFTWYDLETITRESNVVPMKVASTAKYRVNLSTEKRKGMEAALELTDSLYFDPD